MSKGLQHLTSTAVRGACLNPARKTPAQRLARTLLLTATTLSEWARPMSNILPWIYPTGARGRERSNLLSQLQR